MELNPNYVELYMMKVPELSGDNFEDNIAKNNSNEDNKTPDLLNGIVKVYSFCVHAQ